MFECFALFLWYLRWKASGAETSDGDRLFLLSDVLVSSVCAGFPFMFVIAALDTVDTDTALLVTDLPKGAIRHMMCYISAAVSFSTTAGISRVSPTSLFAPPTPIGHSCNRIGYKLHPTEVPRSRRSAPDRPPPSARRISLAGIIIFFSAALLGLERYRRAVCIPILLG